MHILIVRNNSNPQALEAALVLSAYFSSEGIGWSFADYSDLEGANPRQDIRALIAQGLDMAIVLGGDGSILRTARQIGTSGVPLLGINFGKLGFLANPAECGVLNLVTAALAGEMVRDERSSLCVKVLCDSDLQEGEPSFASIDKKRCFFTLNEVSIERGNNGRAIDFSIDVAGVRLADMRGNGLIVSSATGSTAYALSAGGPLVSPSVKGLVLVPIAPHTLVTRAVVTSANDVVEVDLSNNLYGREPVVFVDGEPLVLDSAVRRVFVQRNAEPTVFLRRGYADFYERAAKDFF